MMSTEPTAMMMGEKGFSDTTIMTMPTMTSARNRRKSVTQNRVTTLSGRQ